MINLHQCHDANDGGMVSAVWSDEIQSLADHDGLQAAVDMQFVHGVLNMISCGCFAHAHHLCDFTGRIAIGQQLKNLQFAFGQPCQAFAPGPCGGAGGHGGGGGGGSDGGGTVSPSSP